MVSHCRASFPLNDLRKQVCSVIYMHAAKVICALEAKPRSLGHDYLSKARLGANERLFCAWLIRVVRVVTQAPRVLHWLG